ncbi:MAG: type II and III secretion system protein [Bryobacteraceae bacterium]
MLCVIGSLLAEEPAPYELYVAAKQYEKKGDVVQAYIFYSEAAAADPTNKKYWQKMQALRTRAALASKVMPSDSPGGSWISAEPEESEESPEDPPPGPKELEEARKPQPPFELDASGGKKDLDIRGDSKSLYEQVAKTYGLDVVFDGEYQPRPSQRLRLEGADYRDALYALMAATGSFIVPISGKVFMVVQDTLQKRASVENNVAMELPIPEAVSLQEAQEMARTVQQVMELQRFYVNGANRTIYFRDRVSKAYPAQQILNQLLHHRPQVDIEIEFLSVGKSSTLNYGVSLPTNLNISSFGRFGVADPVDLTKLGQYLVFGGGQTILGISVLTAQLMANVNNSESRTLLKAEVRSVDGQPASLHVGDKFPLQTSGFNFGAPAGTASGYAPSFSFEDLGLVLKVTPKVHGADEVTLDVDAEFKVLGSGSVNGIPVISNRKFVAQVRLKFDEPAAITGLMSSSQAKTISGIAGVSSLPVMGPFLRNNTKEDSKSEILLLITPHLLNLPPTEADVRPVFVGPDTRPRTPL